MEKILLMRQNIGRISDKILNLSIEYGTVDILRRYLELDSEFSELLESFFGIGMD